MLNLFHTFLIHSIYIFLPLNTLWALLVFPDFLSSRTRLERRSSYIALKPPLERCSPLTFLAKARPSPPHQRLSRMHYCVQSMSSWSAAFPDTNYHWWRTLAIKRKSTTSKRQQRARIAFHSYWSCFESALSENVWLPTVWIYATSVHLSPPLQQRESCVLNVKESKNNRRYSLYYWAKMRPKNGCWIHNQIHWGETVGVVGYEWCETYVIQKVKDRVE